MSTWNMGQAVTLVKVVEERAGSVRPRSCDPPRSGDDPISLVHAAVQAVLLDMRRKGQPGMDIHVQVCLERLFSLRHAQSLPPGTRELRIGPGTVVTPLARDLLRRQGIAIHLGLPQGLRARAAGEWAFSIAVASEAGKILALRRALVEDPDTWLELPAGLDMAASWLQASSGRGVLLLTDEPELSIWRACQQPGIRGAVAREPFEVHRAARSLGINLLAVDPASHSLSWIKQLGRAFRQAGAPEAPRDLCLENLPCASPR